jgi:glycosidase
MARVWKTLALATALAASAPIAAQAPDYGATTVRQRPPQDEIIYFVLPDRFANGDVSNDRGGLKGDRLKTGFDPAHKGFFHGGDLKGLTDKLDYIQRLGVTAIWFAPIFQNKPVQGEPGQESAGYHGYWVTDFTKVDSHFGTNDEFRAFVDAAHARGIKVYMDIITNHTADVIYFKECVGQPVCAYRSKADYPYWTRGGLKGARINGGFEGDQVRTAENFAQLTDPTYAYTPQLPKGEEQIKVPAWLNDPIHYHNRGNTSFYGEDSRYGDFVGLDDLMTESPRVVDGFIDIYGSWIDRFGVDGFRIDTARHVNPEFWASFAPAMLERAKAKGIEHFHIFGEVANDAMDPGFLAQHTRRDKLPAVLDFAFQAAVRDMLTGKAGTDLFASLIAGDVLYEGGEATALTLPTFLGNHDMGRLGHMLDKAHPGASEAERLDWMKLAHVLLMTARGVPTIYYGDEQGFTGDGNDQDAREDMFASRVASYNDNRLVGSSATTAAENFDPAHPLYALIAELSAIRKAHPRLRDGRTVLRHYGPKPGLLAFTRGEDDGEEILVAVNTSDQPVSLNVEVGYRSRAFIGLAGSCPTTASAPGSVAISLPPLGYAICRATPID